MRWNTLHHHIKLWDLKRKRQTLCCLLIWSFSWSPSLLVIWTYLSLEHHKPSEKKSEYYLVYVCNVCNTVCVKMDEKCLKDCSPVVSCLISNKIYWIQLLCQFFTFHLILLLEPCCQVGAIFIHTFMGKAVETEKLKPLAYGHEASN